MVLCLGCPCFGWAAQHIGRALYMELLDGLTVGLTVRRLRGAREAEAARGGGLSPAAQLTGPACSLLAAGPHPLPRQELGYLAEAPRERACGAKASRHTESKRMITRQNHTPSPASSCSHAQQLR